MHARPSTWPSYLVPRPFIVPSFSLVSLMPGHPFSTRPTSHVSPAAQALGLAKYRWPTPLVCAASKSSPTDVDLIAPGPLQLGPRSRLPSLALFWILSYSPLFLVPFLTFYSLTFALSQHYVPLIALTVQSVASGLDSAFFPLHPPLLLIMCILEYLSLLYCPRVNTYRPNLASSKRQLCAPIIHSLARVRTPPGCGQVYHLPAVTSMKSPPSDQRTNPELDLSECVRKMIEK